ncbi:hypothetical protein yc1106_08660 [Curvularia clavata]|uniref:Inner centromere protein ARK-binding domain-containing protein n=1 Tax=Curvularia clavata TaxID=95742 RepID=A0A9Q8ZDP8_CURCL|nr:hypothetical protein yc1106_08660 [Curvularia clavata]
MAARSKAPTIGSAGWILEERHQSTTLVAQELEDFGFSVRNELEWLNEHMFDILASDRQPNLDVFKTPGKLRGKTPRTARKKAADRQACSFLPLASIKSANSQHILSPAEQSLRNVKARFQIAEDAANTVRQSPVTRTPIARQLFTKPDSAGKENVNSSYHADLFEKRQAHPVAALRSPIQSTQDTVLSSQPSEVFSPMQSQETQPTQPAQSFRYSIDGKPTKSDTGDSFVSANEGFASKNSSQDNSHEKDASDMELDGERSRSDAQDTMLHHEISDAEDADMEDLPEFPDPPRAVSEQYSISAETHDAPDTANRRALAPEPKYFAPEQSTTPVGLPPTLPEANAHDDTVLHHDVDDQMDIDDDVRSPSENSSPVKPLVRKSSLTFSSLPAREPLLPKKSMGNRVSRTSHLDQNKARNSHMARFTGGKSLGGSQIAYPTEMHHEDDDMDVDTEHPEHHKEEAESTKAHSKTSTQRLFERINMLKQQNEAPKRVSQTIASAQPSQSHGFSTLPDEDAAPTQATQPAYPSLPAPEPTQEDDDDDWISPVRTTAPAPKSRPAIGKSHTTEAHPSPPKPIPAKLTSISNPDLTADAESTTPVGSPTNRRYMDAPISASKSKLYSAFRAAKDKLIGSTATSAQAKMDTLKESPARPKMPFQDSSDDALSSPRRADRPVSIFSHMRSPSKDSDNSIKSGNSSSSPFKSDGRRTRSSTEREKVEKETREKEVREAKQQQRTEDKLKQMREKEQSKAAAHAQKARAMGAKTPTAMSSQSSLRLPTATANLKTPIQASQPAQPTPQQPIARPGVPRSNTATSREEVDSAEDMPPPPPKSLLPTTKPTKAPLREPRKLAKPASKDTIPKAKAPQKIMVNLKSSHYGQAPPPAARPATAAARPISAAPQVGPKAATTGRQTPGGAPRPASALSAKSGPSKTAQPLAKAPAARTARPQPQPVEKAKAPASQPARADLGTARPMSRMQTVQDANRINIPPVNPAKPPPKRQFPGEGDEPLQRPAKRPSQLAKTLNPMTPAHAQFAKGKIPFAESTHQAQSQVPQMQYPNGEDIKLPEIMTDSEDEDSDNEFEPPSWVNTPNLREMLSNQQLMDPEHIFGPIAPLEMEKVFPNKERHKRFRERTSSAYWANDEVTAEEKRKEREARERLVRDGGWTYNPSPLPKQSGSSR